MGGVKPQTAFESWIPSTPVPNRPISRQYVNGDMVTNRDWRSRLRYCNARLGKMLLTLTGAHLNHNYRLAAKFHIERALNKIIL